MDHGDDEAAGSRPSDLPRRMPDIRTYCDDDVVRSADGKWQIRDADDWQYLILVDRFQWNFPQALAVGVAVAQKVYRGQHRGQRSRLQQDQMHFCDRGTHFSNMASSFLVCVLFVIAVCFIVIASALERLTCEMTNASSWVSCIFSQFFGST